MKILIDYDFDFDVDRAANIESEARQQLNDRFERLGLKIEIISFGDWEYEEEFFISVRLQGEELDLYKLILNDSKIKERSLEEYIEECIKTMNGMRIL